MGDCHEGHSIPFCVLLILKGMVLAIESNKMVRADIFSLLRRPGIDSKDLIPPTYVAKDGLVKLLRSPGIDFNFRQPT